MKWLTLVRHAESKWNQPGYTDFSRPIDPQGERDAQQIGTLLTERGFSADAVFTSSARRAQQTAQILASVLGYPVSEIVVKNSLYGAGQAKIFSIIENLDDTLKRVTVIGHNPCWTELANSLVSGQGPSHLELPTCAAVEVELSISSWNEVYPGCGKILHYDFLYGL